MTRICVTILDHHCFRYGLSSVWCQTIIWNNTKLLRICLDFSVSIIEGTITETSDTTLKNIYEYLIWIHNGLFIRPMYIWDISWVIFLGTIFAIGCWDTYISSTLPIVPRISAVDHRLMLATEPTRWDLHVYITKTWWCHFSLQCGLCMSDPRESWSCKQIWGTKVDHVTERKSAILSHGSKL